MLDIAETLSQAAEKSAQPKELINKDSDHLLEEVPDSILESEDEDISKPISNRFQTLKDAEEGRLTSHEKVATTP
ncbi:UNVERIFIED_CONTAM: hypothetical protein Sradi_5874900 [Sesamum radiatum]|uniref:Uncharacterized protein n=1 Tax=Sesamum radiatum TaxID=300843 RepID=A0AAW2KUC1_SESRA